MSLLHNAYKCVTMSTPLVINVDVIFGDYFSIGLQFVGCSSNPRLYFHNGFFFANLFVTANKSLDKHSPNADFNRSSSSVRTI